VLKPVIVGFPPLPLPNAPRPELPERADENGLVVVETEPNPEAPPKTELDPIEAKGDFTFVVEAPIGVGAGGGGTGFRPELIAPNGLADAGAVPSDPNGELDD
jgi:hypothetical protein